MEFLWDAELQAPACANLQREAGLDVKKFQNYFEENQTLEDLTPRMRPTHGTRTDWLNASRCNKKFWGGDRPAPALLRSKTAKK